MGVIAIWLRLLAALLTIAAFFFVPALPVEARRAVFTIGNNTYTVDGESRMMDVAPYIKAGRVHLPVRFAGNALGIADRNIFWDNAAATVTLVKDDQVVRLTVGRRAMTVNGTEIAIDTEPEVVSGRIMLPVRWIAVAFGFQVNWNSTTQTISITAPAVSAPLTAQMPPFTPPLPLLQTPDAPPLPALPPVTAPLPEQAVTTPPAAQPLPDTIERNFHWDFGGRRWSWRLHVPRIAYEYYTSLKRTPTHDKSVYVTDPADDPFIAAMANGFLEVARRERYSPKQTVEFAIAFVQSLEYVTDDISKGLAEYPRYPLETLAEQQGDCEDTAILLASILQKMGFDAVLLALFGFPPGSPGHMAVGVKGEDLPGAYYEHAGGRYYYVETTGTGWAIGEIPDEYRHWEARILPLVPRAVIVHEWVSRGVHGGYVELNVTVHNYGTAAQEIKVYADLDAGGGMAYDQQASQPLILGPRARGVYTLYLKPPANVNTRLNIRIIGDGYLVDESASRWFMT